MLSRERTLALDEWLKEATAGLCEPAVAEIGQRVRAEVEASAERLARGGLPVDEAERLAISELGNPDARNAEWRKLHLHPSQYSMVARYLKPTKKSPASAKWYHPFIILAPIILLFGILALFLASTGKTGVAQLLILGAILLGIILFVILRLRLRLFEHWLIMPRNNTALSLALNREWRVVAAPLLMLLFLKMFQLYVHTFDDPPFSSLEERMLVLTPLSLSLLLVLFWLISRYIIKLVTRLEEQGFQYVVPESMRAPQTDAQAIAPSRA